MPYDPNFPPHNVELISAQWRDQFHGLKDLIDAGLLTGVVVDAVNTVAPGNPANVTASIVVGVLHLTFDIPQGSEGAQGQPGNNGSDGQQGQPGQNGNDGQPGEVTNAALAAAIAGTAPVANGVATLALSASGSYDASQFQAVIDKQNELILALRRP